MNVGKSKKDGLTGEVDGDKIKLKDEYIGKSLGAKLRNYSVLDLEIGEEYHIVEGTYIKDKEVFAGKGVRTKYEKAFLYANRYGGKLEDWQHIKGKALLSTADGDRIGEIHCSECENIGKVDLFLKRWLD